MKVNLEMIEEAKEIQSHLSAQDASLEHLIGRVEALEAKLSEALAALPSKGKN